MNLLLPLSGQSINVFLVASLGFAIGTLSGLVGVGGGFLLTPMLDVLFGIPYHLAVGSSLAQMVGVGTAATVRHSRYGNVDSRLSLLMVAPGALGVEAGARVLEALQHAGTVAVNGREVALMHLVMSGLFVIVPGLVGLSVWREARRACRAGAGEQAPPEALGRRRLLEIRVPPLVSLPVSGVEQVSLWVLSALAAGAGFASGLLGIGGGLILVPAMIYLLGVRTTVAVGSGLLQVALLAGLGALSHSLKGNVDLVLACVLLLGSSLGAQLGAMLTSRIGGPRVRMAFAGTAFLAVAAVGTKLVLLLGLF